MSKDYKNDECVICRSEIYLNPSMKLVVSDCGHNFCETCVNRTFQANKTSLDCPVCKRILKKKSFQGTGSHLLDPEFEKEIKIRKEVLRDYYKRREDFKTLEQYNDYLEEIEDIIFELSNEMNVEKNNQKIQLFKKENAELLQLNLAKKEEDERKLEQEIKRMEKEKEEKKMRQEQKKEIQPSDSQRNDSSLNLPQQITSTPKQAYVPSVQRAQSQTYLPTVQRAQSQTFTPVPQGGPAIIEKSQTEEKKSSKEIDEIRKKAGGWKDEYTLNRSIEESLSSLWIT